MWRLRLCHSAHSTTDSTTDAFGIPAPRGPQTGRGQAVSGPGQSAPPVVANEQTRLRLSDCGQFDRLRVRQRQIELAVGIALRRVVAVLQQHVARMFGAVVPLLVAALLCFELVATVAQGPCQLGPLLGAQVAARYGYRLAQVRSATLAQLNRARLCTMTIHHRQLDEADRFSIDPQPQP